MWAVEVVIEHELVEIVLELRQAVVSGLSQCHLQELFKDCPVESFSEAVCPGMLHLGVSMAYPGHFQEELEVVTTPFPVSCELFSVVCQDGSDGHIVA